MKKRKKERYKILRGLLLHAATAGGMLILCAILYFYVFLQYTTRHREVVSVPDLQGIQLNELDDFLSNYKLRYEVSDSSYTSKAPPLTVLQQFPKATSLVKENRRIYVTINQTTPPTVPLPDIIDQSKINAEAVLSSNYLRVGRIISVPSPFFNLIKEMRYLDKPVEAGTPVPKGAIIDLVVGDGKGQSIFEMISLAGASYEQVVSKLEEWNLNIGSVNIPEGLDTTEIFPVVYRQYPDVGELVRIGDPIDIWLAPPGYEPEDEDIDDD